ncbi:hypothetical protein ACI2OX_10525 [Bacillus sp. N9]
MKSSTFPKGNSHSYLLYAKENVKLGDTITLSHPTFQLELKVVDFVRDIQMNPSIIHSKRFVVHEADLQMLKRSFHEMEYLIEFQLRDLKQLNTFRQLYEEANLPKKAPILIFICLRL